MGLDLLSLYTGCKLTGGGALLQKIILFPTCHTGCCIAEFSCGEVVANCFESVNSICALCVRASLLEAKMVSAVQRASAHQKPKPPQSLQETRNVICGAKEVKKSVMVCQSDV